MRKIIKNNVSKSFVEKRDRTEKVINYTLKIKSSFSYANTVA